LLGIFYQYNKGTEGKWGLWLISLLFIMTGLAIVVYLNQYPLQPRERDYAYAGSFYAFSMWIGLGVLALYEGLKKILPDTVNASLVSLVTLILVPGIMIAENYNDHDRSNRYTARDLGANYLKTCAEQAVIFTNGDNDTFPLWYNQEVEHVRTDLRVCNLSYLQTDWYISQMKKKAYESKPLPFSLKEEQYTQGTRDLVYVLNDPRLKREYVDLREAVRFVADDNPETKLSQAENAAFIPKKKIAFKIDKEAVIRNKVVRPEDYNKIADTMFIDFSDKDYLPKDEFMILDLLANNNWERPIYFAITVGGSKYLNLQNYFQLEGFAYRLVPIFTGGGGLDRVNFGQVATDIMYDNVMNKFKWGNMNNPKVYIDENNSRMMTNIRNNFNRLASALVQEGKKDSAITVIEKGFELVPTSIVPAEYFSLEMINTLYQAGAKEKASKLAEESFKSYNDMIAYLLSLPKKFQKSGDVDDELQRNLFFMQKLQRICQSFKADVLEKKINGTMQEYFKRYSGK
jgi:tetratricopeptide (TPR) repeat protein